MHVSDEEEEFKLEDYEEDMAWVTPDDSLEAALRAFDRTGHERLPVVDSMDTISLNGRINHVDALDAYNQALIAATEEEHK